MLPLFVVLIAFLNLSLVIANTEKAILIAPETLQIRNTHPDLYNLNLEILSPTESDIRKHLHVSFSTNEEPKGSQSWYLLDHLEPGRRYEVRICWAAVVSHR